MIQDLLNMVCTRICHDLISSSQGIVQGVESLDDPDKDFVEQSKNFIKDSANTLNSKLVYFRSLCGRAGKIASVEEVKEIGENFINSYNKKVYGVTCQISGMCEDLTLLKIGLGFYCIATDTLIRGGNIDLKFEDSCLVCTMNGERLKLNDLVIEALNGDFSNIDPKSAVAGYIRLMMEDAGLKINIEVEEGIVNFIIK